MSKYQNTNWINIKIDKLNSLEEACCYCCSRIKDNLHCHHCEYKGITSEEKIANTLLDDLVLLCDGCHQLLHTFYLVGIIKSFDLRDNNILDEFRNLLRNINYLDRPKNNKYTGKECKLLILEKLKKKLPKRIKKIN